MLSASALTIYEQKSSQESKGRRQRGRVVRASDLKSVGRGFESRSDHMTGLKTHAL